VGECFFWYRPTRVVPNKRPLNSSVKYDFFPAIHGRKREHGLNAEAVLISEFVKICVKIGMSVAITVSIESCHFTMPVSMTLSEMPTSVALPTSHHFYPSLSPVVSLSLGILHEWMRTQMLAKPSSNLLQRTGGDRPPGRPRTTWIKNTYDDMSSLDLGIHEARDLAQNRPLQRLSLHGATHS